MCHPLRCPFIGVVFVQSGADNPTLTPRTVITMHTHDVRRRQTVRSVHDRQSAEFEEQLALLIADPVNEWWASVRDRLRVVLQQPDVSDEVGWLVGWLVVAGFVWLEKGSDRNNKRKRREGRSFGVRALFDNWLFNRFLSRCRVSPHLQLLCFWVAARLPIFPPCHRRNTRASANARPGCRHPEGV